jgi:hypothetical protein
MSDNSPKSWSQVAGMQSAWLLNYDTATYPFARYFCDKVFRVDDLEKLHQSSLCTPGSPAGYSDNLRLRQWMQRLPLSSDFYVIYTRFVHELVVRYFGGRISYAARPKMRVHLAGSGSVSRWHRDANVTGRLEQINIWLPATNCFAGNTLWVEDNYGTEHYQPILVRHGQALFFDGGLLSHGSVANETDTSRVSFDLRFSPSSPTPSAMTIRLMAGRPSPSIVAQLCPSLPSP